MSRCWNLAGTLFAELGNSGKVGGTGGEMEELLVFCGKVGGNVREKHKKYIFGT